MKWIFGKIERAYDKKISSAGLSVFRITYSAVLFCEVLHQMYFRHLVFDPVPFLEYCEVDFILAFQLWLVFIFFINIGFMTRLSVIVNYVFSITFFATVSSFEYHMFYAYMGINFILMFLPLSNSFSVDRMIKRVKYSSAHYTYNPSTEVSVIYYYIPVFVAIGLVYFDSIFYKFNSPSWLSGLGMWKPCVLPQFNHYGNSFVLNNKFFSLSFGYVTLLFEAVFIFLFWYKPFRSWFVLIGLGLHIGILVFFPIPWFALGVSAIYLLLVPVSFWKKAGKIFSSDKQSITFIYDGDCPLCNRVRVIIGSLDIFNRIAFVTVQRAKERFKELDRINEEQLIVDIHSVDNKGKARKGIDTYISVLLRMYYTAPFGFLLKIPGIYHTARKIYSLVAVNRDRNVCNDENCIVIIPPHIDENKKMIGVFTLRTIRISLLIFFFISIVFMQICASYHSGLIRKFIHSSGFSGTTTGDLIGGFTKKIAKKSKRYFGITNHPVFMDSHMDGYNHIVAVLYIDKRGTETWLPIIDRNGQPGYYIYGSNWVKWTFRVNAPETNPFVLRDGIKKFTAFWAGKNNIDLNDATFKIVVKKIDVPDRWEKNWLTDQMNKPWIEAGIAQWTNAKFTAEIKSLEEM